MTTEPNSLGSQGGACTLCESDTHRYGVWYTLASETMVGKQSLAGGAWEVFEITGAARTALGMPVDNDEHNYPSIAIDGLGKLHVWTDMHNDPLRYIVSNAAETITAWTAGTLSGSMQEYSYPRPMHRPDGSVRLVFRAAPNTVSGSSQCDTYYWDMAANASTFGSPTMLFKGCSVPNAKGPGVTGDPAAAGGDTIYNWSCYYASTTTFDGGSNYTDHYFGTWRELAVGGPDPERTNVEPFYCQYRSTTGTWHAVDGTALTLPLDPINTTAMQTGLASDGEGYLNFQGIAIDPATGWPHCFLSRGPYYYIHWNGSAWVQETQDDPLTLHSWSLQGYLDPVFCHGRLWVLASGLDEGIRRPVLCRADDSAHVIMGGDIPGSEGWSPMHSEQAMTNRGMVETLTPEGNVPKVVSFGGGVRMAAA